MMPGQLELPADQLPVTSKAHQASMSIAQQERHRIGRIGWLRAAVLGANDGILSTASLLLGVATAHENVAMLAYTL
jgi:VIT1/CCC1 family predicted Fe2+/Mn2+ transporter